MDPDDVEKCQLLFKCVFLIINFNANSLHVQTVVYCTLIFFWVMVIVNNTI